MKYYLLICLAFIACTANAEEFDPEKFARNYFGAWAETQTPTATKEDVEAYLLFLTDDVGHQHLPYDPDADRLPDGKERMREGMSYYLGAHTDYTGALVSTMHGDNVVVITYDTHSKGIHPQTEEVIESNYRTLEVLEIENGKVSVIRKYSE